MERVFYGSQLDVKRLRYILQLHIARKMKIEYLTCQFIGLHYVIENLLCNNLVADNILKPLLRLGHLPFDSDHFFFGIVGKGGNLVILLPARKIGAAFKLRYIYRKASGLSMSSCPFSLMRLKKRV